MRLAFSFSAALYCCSAFSPCSICTTTSRPSHSRRRSQGALFAAAASAAATPDDDESLWNGKSEPLAVSAGLIPRGGKHVSEDVVTKTHTFDVVIEAPLGISLRQTSEGVAVSGLKRGGGAEAAGCRVGDIVVATSATIGDAMWPKTTLAGVESALRSRLRLAKWTNGTTAASSSSAEGARSRVTLRLLRSFEDSETAMSLVRSAESVTESWDVSLKKPLGLTLRKLPEYRGVSVTSVRAGSARDDGRIKRGDRITMVSAGPFSKKSMAPCESVEDVIKAAAQREVVKLRMERQVSVGGFDRQSATTPSPSRPSKKTTTAKDESELVRAAAERRVALDVGKAILAYRELAENGLPATATVSLLLERCSTLCRTYSRLAETVPDSKAGQSLAVASLDALLDSALAGVPLSAKFVTNALTAYTFVGRADKAAALYERIVATKGVPGGANCQLATAAITAYRKLRRTDKAFDVVASQPEESPISRDPDSQLCNALLTASARASPPFKFNERGRTERLFDAMRRPGGVRDFFFGLRAAKSDIVFFNDASSKSPGRDRIGDEELSFDDGPVLADAVSYNVMVDYYARLKNPEAAERVMDEMREAGHVPDRVAYTALVKAYAETSRPDDAQSAFDDLADWLQSSGVGRHRVPDMAAWNTLVRSYSVAARWRDAATVVRRMRSCGIEPNLLTYTNLASGAMRAGQYRVALDAIEELDQAYVTKQQNQLLDEEAEDEEDDENLLNARRRARRVKPNVFAFTIKILAHAKLGDLSGAVGTLRRMRECNIAPNSRTVAALLEACLAADQPKAGQILAEEMRAVEGLKEDIVTKTLLLRCHLGAGDPDKARKLLREMEAVSKRQDRPNLVTYNAAIAGFARLGLFDDALAALESIIERYTPNKATWAALLVHETEGERINVDFVYRAIKTIAENSNAAVAEPVYEAFLVAAAETQSHEKCDDLASKRADGTLTLLSPTPDEDEPRLRRLEMAARGLGRKTNEGAPLATAPKKSG